MTTSLPAHAAMLALFATAFVLGLVFNAAPGVVFAETVRQGMTRLGAVRRALVLAGLLALAGPAAAMTEKEASANLMYFAFAMKEGEICERLGFPGMWALRPWEQKNGDALVRSLRRIEDYAAASGKVTREQAKDLALGLLVRHKETYDREMAPGVSQKSCMRFGETLRLYETKLVRD